MPPILAIGAIAAVGLLAVKIFQQASAEHDRELAFRAANGWSLDEVAKELVGGFDSDRDGRLAFDAVKGVRTLGESVRVDTYAFKTSPGLLGLILPAGTQVIRERRTTYSIEPLLRKADADGDGVATMAEIQQVLRAFDTDGNGRLSAAERAAATTASGEVKVSVDERTVGIVQPPAPPAKPASPKPAQPQPKSPTPVSPQP
jgi:Ca2+-binding EF-hand superfamily protein